MKTQTMKKLILSQSQRSSFSLSQRLIAWSVVFLTIISAQQLLAASDTWQGAAGTQIWNDSDNWISGNIPGSTSATNTLDDATFNGAAGGASAITIDANRNIRKILFTSTTLSYTLGSEGANGGNALLISNNGAVGILSNVIGAVAQTVNAPLIFQGTTGELWSDSSTATATMTFNGNISFAGVGTMTLGLRGRNASTNTISGVISNGSGGGTLGINKAGQNSTLWILGGTNTYTGSTVVTGGTLRAGSTQAFGTNSAVILGSTTSGVTANIDLAGNNNSISSLATTSSALSNGTVTLGSGTLTITGANADSADFMGVISGSGGIIKSGEGTQILSGNNTYTGSTVLSEGMLIINGSLANGSPVSATGGTLGGTGTINGTTTLFGGAKLSAGAVATLAGTLTFSNGLDLSASSDKTGAYLFDLNTVGSSDKIILTSATVGALNVGLLEASDFTFTLGTGFGIGTYVLFDANSTIAGDLGTLTTIDFGGGLSGTLSIDSINNDVLLTVVPEPSITLLFGLGISLTLLRLNRRKFSA